MISIPRSTAEFLLGAPPACLKLYIYAVLRNGADLTQISEETGFSVLELEDAMQYLKEKGVFIRRGADKIIICIPKEEEDCDEALYTDMENVKMLQALFSDRILSSRDYTAIRECKTVYGLPDEVVTRLVEHCVMTSRAKNRVSMSYIQKKAAEWAEAGINTLELAERRADMERSDSQNLHEILGRLGIRSRQASDEERKLFNKWVNEYGMDMEAISAAMPATLSAQNPSIKYLDRILSELYSQGKTTASAISEELNDKDYIDEQIKKLLESIGAPKRTVTEEMRRAYVRFLSMGFTQEEILLAGKKAMEDGMATFKNVEMTLAGWASRGLTNRKSIEDFLNEIESDKMRAAQMLKRMGVSRVVSDKDIAMVNKYLKKGMSEDAILYAAECAYGAAAPIKLTQTILKNWSEMNIKTLEEAKKQNESHRANKNLTKLDDERAYTDSEFKQKIRDPIAEL